MKRKFAIRTAGVLIAGLLAVLVLSRYQHTSSDRRNRDGVPYVIHHNDPWQTAYEQDILEKCTDIVGHYRISQ